MIHFEVTYCLTPLDNIPTIYRKDVFAENLEKAKQYFLSQVEGNPIILEIIPVENL